MTNSPTSKHVLTSIIASLQNLALLELPTTASDAPPLQLSAHPSFKPALLTLHFLFPHELLPALDLIDRRLLTHLFTPASDSDGSRIEVFYVQSASTPGAGTSTGRFRNALGKNQSYEVRLDGWNCGCPAFAYSSLKLLMKGPRQESEIEGVHDEIQQPGWMFGGAATKDDVVVPVCKHILAVVLAKGVPRLFGNGMVQREVSADEIAGWAAGWGEH